MALSTVHSQVNVEGVGKRPACLPFPPCCAPSPELPSAASSARPRVPRRPDHDQRLLLSHPPAGQSVSPALLSQAATEFSRSSKPGPYLSAPLPMAAHLWLRSGQSACSSALCFVSFSERIQLLLGKLPVGTFRFCCFPARCPKRQGRRENERDQPVVFSSFLFFLTYMRGAGRRGLYLSYSYLHGCSREK